ncbi:MAG: hypothetical protein MI741_01570, partial [Rhodospirillales bacterium]|nr:hypothetical protein [Rhodospirillales bacterium]
PRRLPRRRRLGLRFFGMSLAFRVNQYLCTTFRIACERRRRGGVCSTRSRLQRDFSKSSTAVWLIRQVGRRAVDDFATLVACNSPLAIQANTTFTPTLIRSASCFGV